MKGWPSWLTYSGWLTDNSGQWSPISCRSSAGQGKFAGQRPTFYHCATPPTTARVLRLNHCDSELRWLIGLWRLCLTNVKSLLQLRACRRNSINKSNVTRCWHTTAGCRPITGCIQPQLYGLYEHSRLYNRLGELCKWAQPSGAWAVQPGRLWRH